MSCPTPNTHPHPHSPPTPSPCRGRVGQCMGFVWGFMQMSLYSGTWNRHNNNYFCYTMLTQIKYHVQCTNPHNSIHTSLLYKCPHPGEVSLNLFPQQCPYSSPTLCWLKYGVQLIHFVHTVYMHLLHMYLHCTTYIVLPTCTSTCHAYAYKLVTLEVMS